MKTIKFLQSEINEVLYQMKMEKVKPFKERKDLKKRDRITLRLKTFFKRNKRGAYINRKNIKKGKNKINWDKYARIFWDDTKEEKIIYPYVRRIDEEKIEIQNEYCIEFTCDRKLSLREKLFGKRCINHQISQNADVEYR